MPYCKLAFPSQHSSWVHMVDSIKKMNLGSDRQVYKTTHIAMPSGYSPSRVPGYDKLISRTDTHKTDSGNHCFY